ncbi:sensor histidine kinase [Marinobacterium marinum]|uniref:histidine kinase n=1 Tax=Marinobacterium marinum TaxID=2756129 RepID=A0A7W2AB11_9GAMM|nr:HAMP domain-containing sensor histidine kinase [Marinobacterium marinum]MBA4502466.1 HAMP domain-containing protein [Marinobacterium marinum]
MAAYPQQKQLSSQYLWLSLIVALVPLLSFTALYDSYFAQLVTRITDGRLATHLAATRNEFRTHLRERQYELEALTDQLDRSELFTREGYHALSPELKSLLRLQLDDQAVYGIAFFDAQDNLLWSFPSQTLTQTRYQQMQQSPTSTFESVDLIGPGEHSWNTPPALLMRKKVTFSALTPAENAPSIALILRFNTLAGIPRNLQLGGVYKALLRTPDGHSYDTVGQPASPGDTSHHHELIPGWTLQLVQNTELIEPPSAGMRYWLITLVAGTAVSLLLLHWYLSRRLKHQVDVLIQSVEQVANGDLETPVKLLNSAEMGRLTQAIERMRTQLKQVISSTVDMERQASLGQLAAGLAHDIRNPLTTIRTTIQALARREQNAMHKDMLNMVEEEIERVNEVIANLLNFARPRPPQAELIRVCELYEGLIALVSASARHQQVTLAMSCDRALFIRADAGHMRQILMNLILNALQSLEGSGGHIRLTAVTEQKTGAILLTVTDDGPGISDTLLPRITEPFFTTRETGTGLGLAICQVLAASNDARLHIRSQVNRGTSVELRCPAPGHNEANND